MAVIWGWVSEAELARPGIMGVSGQKTGESGATRGVNGCGEVEVSVARSLKDKSKGGGG